jgi:hypothetical protein
MSAGSRNSEFYSVLGAVGQTFASHRLDHWPILPEEPCRVVNILGLHSDAASLPSPTVRYLKIESVARGLRVFIDRLSIAAHSVSPCIASNWDTLRFANWPFVRRECGAWARRDSA